MKHIYFFILFFTVHFSVFPQKLTNERARWFTDSRFGMFIHWGVYSGAEGIWKGEKLRNDNDYAEWIMYRNRIARDEYVSLLDRFDWNEINPEEWVILAKNSGMKYVTLTAKHHDGFALWNSRTGDYHIGYYTNPQRDIVKELADACKKHGLKMGLYYSHWIDWEHEYGWDHTKEITGISPDNYNRYWQKKVIPQIRELLTDYGEIAMFWFDMWIHHSQTVVTKEQLLQLKGLIRELQPDCIINSRLGLSIEEDPDVDFKTLGDNQLGTQKEDFPWQSPATVAHSWGFHALDTEWKSTTTLLKSLINNVSLNGNFMLNIGPRANGKVPLEISQRMLEMGRWLNVNGESIYGAEAFDLENNLHDWGKITCRETKTGTKLYLHVFNWPLNKQLHLTGIKSTPEKVYLLTDKQQKPLAFTHDGLFTQIDLPVMEPDPYISVLVVEFDKYPDTEHITIAKTTDGGYSLIPENQIQRDRNMILQAKNRRGTVPRHVSVRNLQTMKWEIYVDAPGKKTVDISYSMQEERNGGSIEIRTAGEILIHKIVSTGKTVGEPNSEWIIDNFKSQRAGEVTFPERGLYEIECEIVPGINDEVKFQWIWLK